MRLKPLVWLMPFCAWSFSALAAEDLFDAHQKCDASAKKLGSSFVRLSDPNFKNEFVSHYDSKTGNCYLKYSKLSNSGVRLITEQLYDVHNGELLASHSTENKEGSLINDEAYTSTEAYERELQTHLKYSNVAPHPAAHYIGMKMSSGR
jgi:hypothetical protein